MSFKTPGSAVRGVQVLEEVAVGDAQGHRRQVLGGTLQRAAPTTEIRRLKISDRVLQTHFTR